MRRGFQLAGFAMASLLAGACTAPTGGQAAPRIAVGGTSSLVDVFVRVGAETQIPAELLAAMSYVETRMAFVDSHEHGATALGLLGLSEEALVHGAQLAGVTDLAAHTDPEASLRAGAALLRAAAPRARTLEEFLAVIDEGRRADVIAALARGIDGHDAAGESVTIAARPGLAPRADANLGTTTQALGAADYGPAAWVAAISSNYQVANRAKGMIDHIVIHTTEGSYAGTISWFKDPAAKVSAHYVVKSSSGAITQMVHEKDIGWHDACFNTTTVGIEHEGYTTAPATWYTEPMYLESAKLTAYLADKYSIPKEHGSILGHGEAPDCSDHTDPGPGWNWAHYIDLVRTGGVPTLTAADALIDAPESLVSGETGTVTVTMTNTGNVAWDLDLTRVGTAAPQDRASAFFVDGDWMSPSRATGADAHVEPGATGTFTFEITAPEVREDTLFDEAFQLVQEGTTTTWFGPDLHLMVQVTPADGGEGGCSVAGGGSGGAACAMLLLGVSARRRRKSARRL